LRQILVGGRDHAVDARSRRGYGKRADHVVRFDAFDHQQRPAVRPDELVQRLDLPHEVLRHGGRCALYCGYQSSRKVLPGASKTTAK
jgi:hypothetical protein